MRYAALLLALLVSAQAGAQGAPPLPVSVGETLRLTLSGDVAGAYVVGRVRAVEADALVLDAGVASPSTVAWSRIAAVERRGQNRPGEAIGLVVGGAAGALAGFSLGPITGDPLAGAAFVPGALVGLVVGGILGGRHGDRWHEVGPNVPAPGR